MNLNVVLEELQNENKCTIITLKALDSNRESSSLIEVTEAQLENFRIQKRDICFDVEQEIKIKFPGEFEVQLAYVIDDDLDYKKTVYGLYIKRDSLSEECTSAEFQRAAPGKVITMNYQLGKKKLGKKDKYNKLGEGRFIERKRKTPEGYFARKALANRKRLEEMEV